ncbi:CDP-glucose 4,6-dehydratase [Amylibacter sp.]|jgi:CDP-glucose 4,6-dehydratase|nr:CDP-glucose 4,6-dehydratase [Amylibacter sp.]
MNLFKQTYENKTVLITGHTGFKGSWLSLWLSQLGSNVIGVSFDIPTEPSHFNASKLSNRLVDHRLDIMDSKGLKKVVRDSQPDFVFHLAAQALVRQSYQSPVDTIMTNAIGTSNVLDSLMCLDKPVVAVMITSDKAYDNVEWVWGYRETDRLGGKDPYSASKAMAELAIRSYVESFFSAADSNVRLGIARAGNVIGGGDWAKDRIVVDCMESWSEGKIVDIRNPGATRPWQHVLEPLSGYLALGADLVRSHSNHGQAYNFGPPANHNHSVKDLINQMKVYWSNVRWNDISKDEVFMHEAGLLKLNCDKALSDLNWLPTLSFDETVQMTVNWYKEFYETNEDMIYGKSLSQIAEYTNIAEKRGIEWACI